MVGCTYKCGGERQRGQLLEWVAALGNNSAALSTVKAYDLQPALGKISQLKSMACSQRQWVGTSGQTDGSALEERRTGREERTLVQCGPRDHRTVLDAGPRAVQVFSGRRSGCCPRFRTAVIGYPATHLPVAVRFRCSVLAHPGGKAGDTTGRTLDERGCQGTQQPNAARYNICHGGIRLSQNPNPP